MKEAVPYHLFIKPNSNIDLEQMETALAKFLDWFRLGDGCYVIVSRRGADGVYRRVEQIAGDDGIFFFCKLDTSSKNGLMPQDFWDWLKKYSKET